jgi:hypothetical protein
MMLPAVVPWELGSDIPVGMPPATTRQCTGVGVAPLFVVVSQPVVSNQTVDGDPALSAAGGTGAITQLPVGAAGVSGTGVTDGVQPGMRTVAVGVPLFETVSQQSGAEKLVASTLNSPPLSTRPPVLLVVDATVTKVPKIPPRPSTRS